MPEQHTVPLSDLRLPIRTLRVAVVDDKGGGEPLLAASDQLTIGSATGNDLVVADPTVSRFHLELQRTPEGVRVVDCGSTNGTWVGNVRVQQALVVPGTVLRIGRTSLRVTDGDDVTVELPADEQLAGLRGRSLAMRRLMAQIRRAAAAQAAVLLWGESGTGKELIARALAQLGPRASAPFVTVDCGALTPTLVASELFGHERGAFTGATDRHIGAFERANGGTLFLDEIGELPPPLQASLLGVLERQRFRRLGGKDEISVSVRVVSATHRDLRAEVNAGTFRLDLFYRLAVVQLRVPALRERRDDVPLLVEHFLRELGHTAPLAELFSAAALDMLAQHHWPGNVRELRNMVEATVAMGEPPSLPAGAGLDAGDPFAAVLEHSYKDARRAVLEQFEKRYLEALLLRAKGNVTQASRLAAMDRSYLIELLQRHGVR
ncbi:MAG TPA: sigma 54-interacting transcriptional regulator [Nannocystaceae bacterium]|nr:sigma 54-interacting transcriptional regulator [Nannocystaceae bacterium]